MGSCFKCTCSYLSDSISVNINWYYNYERILRNDKMVEIINRNGKFDKYMNKSKIKYRD